MKIRNRASASGLLVCSLLAAACAATGGAPDDETVGTSSYALDGDGLLDAIAGYDFDHALIGTNGRSCATCHVPEDHFTLTPEHVAAVYAKDPHDPLFNPIDADDPTAAVPTYEHLMAGLVRVNVPLAGNLDVIDADGNVITGASRTIAVWRGVPTTENVYFTGPYQYDESAANLRIQADGALHAQSQICYEPWADVLDQIAGYEDATYSSQSAADVAAELAAGRTPPAVDLHFPPGSDEAAGQALFNGVCARCHGTGTTNSPVDKAAFDSFFPVMNAGGTIGYSGFNAAGVAIPVAFRTDLAPPHIGTHGIQRIALLRELGALPNPSGLTFPGYRIRFYTDATRTHQLVDMPPPPPGIGPSLIAEPFSVDPGRALISGDPADWEGIKILELRGISRTAPYFHDASAPDLQTVLDEYSRFILPADPVLNLPYAYAPETPGGLPEALSPTQKAQLLAFLQKL